MPILIPGDTTMVCPECGTEVVVPLDVQDPFDTPVGCLQTDRHDSGEPLVMFPAKEDS